MNFVLVCMDKKEFRILASKHLQEELIFLNEPLYAKMYVVCVCAENPIQGLTLAR